LRKNKGFSRLCPRKEIYDTDSGGIIMNISKLLNKKDEKEEAIAEGKLMPRIIAHRGASWKNGRGNTLEAFQLAIDIKADMVEFDVRKTSDNVLIVYHDSTLDGKKISDLTYNRINDLAKKENYSVPKLEEVLKLCKGKIALDIELKESGYERHVINQVKEMFGYGEFSIKSFKDKVSYNVKSIDPRIRTGLLLGKEHAKCDTRINEFFPMRRIRRCKADFVSPHYLLATPGFVRRMKARNIPVYVWTVNDPHEMKKLSRLKVEAIITDRPEIMMKVRHERLERLFGRHRD
jgi:glycerophosphoryl diester phosphodiesterase